jgi:hypothetical protein
MMKYRKRRVLNFILSLALVLSLTMLFSLLCGAAWATESGSCGENLNWTLNDAGTLHISGTGSMTDFNQDPPWTDYRIRIKAVTIDSGVTSIGTYAFFQCNNLTKITLPNTLDTIGKGAFYFCGKLADITIPDNLTAIEDSTFAGCGSLSSVTIPDNVSSIGTSAFACCDNLTDITIPDKVTTIGDRAFEYCFSLKTIALPDGLKTIRYRTFYGCSGLTGVTIPSSVKTIKNTAFTNCDSLKSVTIPKNVSTIEAFAFGYIVTGENENEDLVKIPGFVIKGYLDTAAEDYAVKNRFKFSSLTPAEIIKKAKITLSKKAFTYNGKVRKPAVKKVTLGSKTLKSGTDYTVKILNSKGKTVASPKSAGTYTVRITGKRHYTGTAKTTYKINKAANKLKVKGKTAKVSYKKLKKKAQTRKVSRVITFTNKGQGTKTYTKKSGSKKITINKKTGKVTVKKGLKKGTYKVRVKVRAAGNTNYKALTRKVTFKIKVN